jgi:hypothetical protein
VIDWLGADVVHSTCIDCGCQILSDRRRKRCDSCSEKHQFEYHKAYNKHYYKPREKCMTVRVCAFCGGEFSALAHSGKNFCSRKCRIHWRTKKNSIIAAEHRANTLLVCPECGVEFTPSNNLHQKYCSATCMKNHNGHESKTKICSVNGCARPMIARGMCLMHYKRWLRSQGKLQDPWNERRRKNYELRRARKKSNGPFEDFSNDEIYERDHWVCGICGNPVDRSLVWPDPMSVSLDHIVPLSRGGAHTRANVRCTHLHCNVSKGAQIVAQQLPKMMKVS